MGGLNSASILDEVRYGAVRTPTSSDAAAELIGRQASSGWLSFYTGMPWSTIAGLTVLHRALVVGDALVPHRGGFDVASLVRGLERGAITSVALAPTMAQLLLREVRVRGIEAANLLSVGIGGGPVPPALSSAVEEELGCVVTVGYGATETGGVVTMTRPTDGETVRHGTVGRAVASVAIRLDGDDADRSGRVSCRTPAAMAGRLTSRGDFERASEWLDLGDAGELDDDGNLRLLGRADFVIIRGGRRIDPSSIENALELHRAVRRAGVFGAPSRIAGETDVVALVERAGPVTGSELREHLSTLAPHVPVPQGIRFVDGIPTAADGGIRRHLLPEISSQGFA